LQSEEGQYKINMKDNELLAETLVEKMGAPISICDFYHDKAFFCFLTLLQKALTAGSSLVLEQKLAFKVWFRNQRKKMHKLMNVADLRLSENYWQQIKRVVSG